MAAAIISPTAGTAFSTIRAEGTRRIVILHGEWDFSTKSQLADLLSRVIALPTGDVVIDLAEVEFIDTATVRAFVISQQLLDRNGRMLNFRSPSKLALRLLDLFGLTDLIETPL
jgi:anti-anti-sigma factor